MSLSNLDRSELSHLLDLLTANALDKSQRARLNDYLRTHDQAVRAYFDYLGIHAALAIRKAVIGDRWTGERSSHASPDTRMAADSTTKSEISTLANSSELQGSTFSVRRSPTVIRHLAGRWTSLGGLSRAIAFGISGLLIVYFALLVFSVVWDQAKWANRVDERPSSQDDLRTVALVADATDAKWSETPMSRRKNAAIKRGEPLKIDSGVVQLKLKHGAALIVEGPAEWSIEGDNRALLESGKITAKVPSQAVGFTIQTPTALVIDLGTEFGVRVDVDGTSDVAVKVGKVEVTSTLPTIHSAAKSRSLVAGEAIRVDARSGMFKSLPVADRQALQSPVSSIPRAATQQDDRTLLWYRMGEDDGTAADFPTITHTQPNPAAAWQQPLKVSGTVQPTAGVDAAFSQHAIHFAPHTEQTMARVREMPALESNWMLEAWVKPDRVDQTAMIAYLGKPYKTGIGLCILRGEWTLSCGVILPSGIKCETDKWTHLAIVRERGRTYLFVNGLHVAVSGSQNDDRVPQDSMMIGGFIDDATSEISESFTGAIDEIRIRQLRRSFDPKVHLKNVTEVAHDKNPE